jgi:hypothetical protein
MTATPVVKLVPPPGAGSAPRVLEQHDEGHLALVSALSAAGRHGEARRRYVVYVGRMEQIGVEPASFPAP